MAAGCPAPLADSGWPRISTTVPKKKKGANKRGKRSLAKQQEQIDRGIRKRQEAQQDRAEARFPELLGRSNSSGDTATRTVVLEDTTDPEQKPRVRSGRPKRVVTEASVRVKRLGETTLVLQASETKPLRLKSVAKSVQHLPEECSSCEEGTKENRSAATKFAQQRLDQRRQRFKPVKPHLTAFIKRFHDLRKKKETKPFPKVKPEEVDAEEDEEEEEEEADPGSNVDFSGDDPSSGGLGGSASATAVVA